MARVTTSVPCSVHCSQFMKQLLCGLLVLASFVKLLLLLNNLDLIPAEIFMSQWPDQEGYLVKTASLL